MDEARERIGLEVPEAVARFAAAVRAAGGRAVMVGGCVRDALLGRPARDRDLEIYGLGAAELRAALAHFGEVIAVGRAFPVFRVKGHDVDCSLPASTRAGLEDAFREAARRRDLTVNSLGYDPLAQRLLDPFGGREDLAARRLRETDARTFGSDPLRGLRVARFRAVLEMEPTDRLRRLCAELDLSALPGERLRVELERLLLEAPRPSRGLEFLRETGLVRFFPELAALVAVPAGPRSRREDDPWAHTLRVVDEAAALRTGEADDDRALMFAALCHGFGEPPVTAGGERDATHGGGHAEAGAASARALLERLRAPHALIGRVTALMRLYARPRELVEGAGGEGDAGASVYRRLARELDRGRVSAELLERLARAHALGHGVADAREAGVEFLDRMTALGLAGERPRDVVQGRHLLARGIAPGPLYSLILERCRAIEDETGERDPDRILDRLLGRVSLAELEREHAAREEETGA